MMGDFTARYRPGQADEAIQKARDKAQDQESRTKGSAASIFGLQASGCLKKRQLALVTGLLAKLTSARWSSKKGTKELAACFGDWDLKDKAKQNCWGSSGFVSLTKREQNKGGGSHQRGHKSPESLKIDTARKSKLRPAFSARSVSGCSCAQIKPSAPRTVPGRQGRDNISKLRQSFMASGGVSRFSPTQMS